LEYAQRLAHDLDLDYETEISVHPAIAGVADAGISTMYIAIGIIVVFFISN